MELLFCKFCNVEHLLTEDNWYFAKKNRRICKKKQKVTMARFYEKNKNKINEAGRQYKRVNKEKVKLQNHDYYERNQVHVRAKTKAYAQSDPDAARERQKAWNVANSEHCKQKNKEFYERNKEKIFEKRRQRLVSNIDLRLASSLRSRLHHALRKNQKNGSAVKDLGCTIEELKMYLESKFQEGMTWDNWSRTGWHIDHIKPLVTYNLSDPIQLKEACHYTNLQPLWAEDNLRKNRYEGISRCPE